MKPLLSAHKRIFFPHKKWERLNHLQMHFYWWSSLSIINLNDCCRIQNLLFSYFACASLFFVCCFFFLHALWTYYDDYFLLNRIITSMFSMTCSLGAFSNWLQTEKATPPRCLSLLAHRIISAWHNSGPDLQSAPTPWMLDASAPIGGSQLLLACFACFGSWCSPGSRVCVVAEFVSRYSCYLCFVCDRPLAAEAALHCEVCATLWSFHWITTVLNVWYFSLYPLSPGSNLTDTQHTD